MIAVNIEEVRLKRRLYARSYRAAVKARKGPKLCQKCNVAPVTHKYCKPCARQVKLDKYKELWATNEEYRKQHRLAARMSFRRRKAKNVASCK
jgi:hypothetical protein